MKTCSIVGARGYTGLETTRLLLRHPQADLQYCFTTAKFNLADAINTAEAKKVKCLLEVDIFSHLTDFVFLATPAEVSLELAPKIIKAGKKVIDLSGAFRLKEHDYQKWYGFIHTEKNLLSQASYGLCPWVGPSKHMKNVENSLHSLLVANPGCFATAVTMALLPLLNNNLIQEENIVIDAKSGSTGAGKKASENLLFSEVTGECLPYKVGCHQHFPEIVEALQFFSGKKIDAHFVTSLLPVRRGIIAGIYAKLNKGFSLKDVENSYTKAYENYPLVQHDAIKDMPWLASLKKVVGTGKTHISYEVVGDRLYLFSCIDNLLKGAASQAVENFNRLSDLPLETGLSQLEVML